ncbi:MAG: M48 family metalloprotease [Burkholderiales bacterium]|nr:M48 family metalloprotease [Burkholderiales bacterium]
MVKTPVALNEASSPGVLRIASSAVALPQAAHWACQRAFVSSGTSNSRGAALAAIDTRYSNSSWRAILIDDFGYGAAAFPGETILVDATFLRTLQVNDDELALILSHEAAHLVAGHAAAKLSFMAEFLGKEKVPTARTALLEFLAKDAYATAYRPTARLQEREADRIGAAILFAAGYDGQRALRVFDKLAALEGGETERAPDSHDIAAARKQAVSEVLADLQRFHAEGNHAPQ